MNMNIHSVHFHADPKLAEYIQMKVQKLHKFYDQIISSEVFLKLGNSGTAEKIVEIKLNVPNHEFFAKRSAGSFEDATGTAIEALRRQLKKHKEKVRGM